MMSVVKLTRPLNSEFDSRVNGSKMLLRVLESS